MSQQNGGQPGSGDGFSSAVEYQGQSFHVQTQYSTRDAPVIESLVFRDGRVLVRITSSYGDVASQLGFTEDDGRHLLELQHADLIRKIRHGMLRGDDVAATSEEPKLVDVEGRVVDPSEVDDPSVQELLSDLGVAVDRIAPPPASKPTPTRSTPRPRRRRGFRLVIRIALPF